MSVLTVAVAAVGNCGSAEVTTGGVATTIGALAVTMGLALLCEIEGVVVRDDMPPIAGVVRRAIEGSPNGLALSWLRPEISNGLTNFVIRFDFSRDDGEAFFAWPADSMGFHRFLFALEL